MEVFFTSLNQMCMVFLFIIAGFILKRKALVPKNTGSVLSKLESQLLLPALILNTFMTRCSLSNLASKTTLLLYSVVIFLPITVVAFWVGKRFSAKSFHQRLYRHAFIVSNYGFMGNALVLGIFGEEALFDYMMFTIPLNILTFSVCVSWLIPNQDKSSNAHLYRTGSWHLVGCDPDPASAVFHVCGFCHCQLYVPCGHAADWYDRGRIWPAQADDHQKGICHLTAASGDHSCHCDHYFKTAAYQR